MGLNEKFGAELERDIALEVGALSPTVTAKLSELELEIISAAILFRRTAAVALNADRQVLTMPQRDQLERTIRIAEVALVETRQLLAQMGGYLRLNGLEREEIDSKFEVLFEGQS